MDSMEHLRALLDQDRVHGPGDDSAGYLDLLPPETQRPRNLAQAAMHNPLLAAVYQRWWRPAGAMLLGAGLPGGDGEARLARRALRLGGEQTVLDVACGPGNFTRGFGEALSGSGFAVGLDVSPPMLARAVRDNAHERVGYLRADARELPFADGTFDAVCCFAALYLVPEPFRVLDELMRVLAPGGRIALLTSVHAGPAPLHPVEDRIATLAGGRMFGRDEITGVLRDAGLVDVDQRVSGLAQFVSAGRVPA